MLQVRVLIIKLVEKDAKTIQTIFLWTFGINLDFLTNELTKLIMRKVFWAQGKSDIISILK